MEEIRTYEAADLPQLTVLVNAHIAAATPGWTVPPAWIAARLHRNPDEYVVDPWVLERRTLVARERERLVACCHLLHYATDERVSDTYRGSGEVGWVFAYPQRHEAGAALLAEAVRQLDGWAVTRQSACGGGLGPEVYGVPDVWPHVHRLLRDAGFDDSGAREEVLYAGSLTALGEAGDPPLAGVSVARETFDAGVAFVALRGEERVAEFRVELPESAELPALARWVEGWGIRVEEEYRRQGVGRWLVRRSARWLVLAGRDRLIVPVGVQQDAGDDRFWGALGLEPVTRIRRGYERPLS